MRLRKKFMKQCRCCGNEITGNPILKYSNMPKAAQFFPDKEEVDKEQGTDLSLYQCDTCGLIQLLDDPVPYYRDVIRTAGISEELKVYRKKFFDEFVDAYQLHGKKIIEIGCGCGEFLSIMETTGVQAYGLEHLADSVQKCKKDHLQVYEGFIETEHTKIENAPYDAFYIMNFLEHIPDPRMFLQGISNNLSEQAVGLIEVPNMDMILEKLMFSEFISDHLLYFTEQSLRNLLEISGFEVVSCKRVWHDYVLSAVVKKRRKINLDGFQRQLNKIKIAVNEFVEPDENGRKTIVWGAGHQALAILALTEIQDKIAFVVDSAEFKQNKYTPGTHIPIVSPEILCDKKNEIGKVLVMAASYSDEVARIIEEKYSYLSIGILRDDGVELIL